MAISEAPSETVAPENVAPEQDAGERDVDALGDRNQITFQVDNMCELSLEQKDEPYNQWGYFTSPPSYVRKP